MEKYIITNDSVIKASSVIRFVANPSGEVRIECTDGIVQRLGSTYQGEKKCKEYLEKWINFITDDNQFLDLKY